MNESVGNKRPGLREQENSNARLLIHGIGPETQPSDIESVFVEFGEVSGITVVRSKERAYIQFKSPESLVKSLLASQKEPLIVKDRQVSLSFSSGKPGKRGPLDLNPPSRILLVTYHQLKSKLRVPDILRIFSGFGAIQKVVMFNKNQICSFIEMKKLEHAIALKEKCDGANLEGLFLAQVQYTDKKSLAVNPNSSTQFDATKTLPFEPTSQTPCGSKSHWKENEAPFFMSGQSQNSNFPKIFNSFSPTISNGFYHRHIHYHYTSAGPKGKAPHKADAEILRKMQIFQDEVRDPFGSLMGMEKVPKEEREITPVFRRKTQEYIDKLAAEAKGMIPSKISTKDTNFKGDSEESDAETLLSQVLANNQQATKVEDCTKEKVGGKYENPDLDTGEQEYPFLNAYQSFTSGKIQKKEAPQEQRYSSCKLPNSNAMSSSIPTSHPITDANQTQQSFSCFFGNTKVGAPVAQDSGFASPEKGLFNSSFPSYAGIGLSTKKDSQEPKTQELSAPVEKKNQSLSPKKVESPSDSVNHPQKAEPEIIPETQNKPKDESSLVQMFKKVPENTYTQGKATPNPEESLKTETQGIAPASKAEAKPVEEGVCEKFLTIRNLPEKRITFEMLFNLCSVYGNIQTIRLFGTKEKIAIVEYQDEYQALIGKKNLHRCPVFGYDVSVSTTSSAERSSTQPFIGSAATEHGYKDFSQFKEQRFKIPGSKNFKNLSAPCQHLHLSNINQSYDQKDLFNLFKTVATPLKVTLFENNRTMGIAVFSTIDQAVRVLMSFHNFAIEKRYPSKIYRS